ncbi:Ppx/GppA phosphatase family protein [Novosphingobium sp. PASSN1]|uniref:Ppx/GppA phosphatase family protein n=1 Tax=Novosphingobium sp. PASSN1 TaxID=2015561 RepID=UPI000BDD6034|nr:Ppx/GppA phosphatase family protein [Novosphingobium sp. PASSN1]OYU33120.1 MAG: exopolyphosphatase [Novosphingobium sp. PASSN1]
MAEFDPPAQQRKARQGKRRGRRGAARGKPQGPRPAPSASASIPDRQSAGPPAENGAATAADPAANIALHAATEAISQTPISQIATATPPLDVPRQPWQKTPPFHRQAYAAIDLGTNNCRLLIARPSGDHFMVIDAFSRVVRLGEGLAQSGRLSDAAMDRALGALHICAEKLRKRGVHLAHSVATEACRRATNGEEFIDRVHRETGIRLNIITAGEEARLAVLGCHILLEPGEGPAMIFDIGGGSTEMVLVDTTDAVPRILDWQSVPWGVVSLTESIGPIDLTAEARAAAYRKMRARITEGFAQFAERVSPAGAAAAASGGLRLLGTSGTVTTLASLHLGLPQYDRSAVDGLIVPTASMREISQRLAHISPAERVAVPCIGRERADLVVAGCAILESIFDIWPAERLGIADRGIREGILRSLMAAGGLGAGNPSAGSPTAGSKTDRRTETAQSKGTSQ